MLQKDFFKLGILLLGITAIAFFVFLLTSRLFFEAFCFASGCGLMCLLQWCAEQKCKDDYRFDGCREGREVRYARLYRRPYDAELGSKSQEGIKCCHKEHQPNLRSCCDCQCEKKEVETKWTSSKELRDEPRKTKSKSRISSKSSSRKKSRKSRKSKKERKDRKEKKLKRKKSSA